MTHERILPWSVTEKIGTGDSLLIAKFDLLADAELFAKAISARMPTFSYFIAADGINGETWQGGYLVK